MSNLSRFVLCLIAAATLAGCTSAASLTNAEYADGSESYASRVPMRGSDGPYLLGPGDRLRIKVYGDDDMTGEYEINSGGAVSLPLVGNVKASGLTTKQLEQKIAAQMKGGVANKPNVNVEIAVYAPFYIYGEVKKAGEYPYIVGITVGDAIATAGGLTYRADERRVILRRAGSNVEQVVPFNAPTRIFPGDNIRVAERIF